MGIERFYSGGQNDEQTRAMVVSKESEIVESRCRVGCGDGGHTAGGTLVRVGEQWRILTATTLLHFSDQDESTVRGMNAKISTPAGTHPSMHKVPMPQ